MFGAKLDELKQRLVALVMSGTSASSLSMAIVAGLVCGIFPIPGLTSVPTVATAFVLRVNVPLALLVNYLATPVNLASFVWFVKLGERALGLTPVDLTTLQTALFDDTLGCLRQFAWSLVAGVLCWLGFALAVSLPLHMAVRALLSRWLQRYLARLEKGEKDKGDKGGGGGVGGGGGEGSKEGSQQGQGGTARNRKRAS